MFAPSRLTNDVPAHADSDKSADAIQSTATSTKQRLSSSINVVASWLHATAILCLVAVAAMMLITFMASTLNIVSDIDMVKNSTSMEQPTVVVHSLQVNTVRRTLNKQR